MVKKSFYSVYSGIIVILVGIMKGVFVLAGSAGLSEFYRKIKNANTMYNKQILTLVTISIMLLTVSCETDYVEPMEDGVAKPAFSQQYIDRVEAYSPLRADADCGTGFGLCTVNSIEDYSAGDYYFNILKPHVNDAGYEVMTLELKEVVSHSVDEMQIKTDIELSKDMANAMGYESIKILSGNYAVDYSSNLLGNIEVSILGIDIRGE